MSTKNVSDANSASKVAEKSVATKSATKATTPKATPAKAKSVKASPAKVVLNKKDFNAANKALKLEFKKLSHVCKYVSRLSKGELIAAMKNSGDGKLEDTKIEAIASLYSLIINEYDLVKVTAMYLPSLGGVHCTKKLVILDDKLEPSRSFNRESDAMLYGEFFKEKGFGVPLVATPDRNKFYQTVNRGNPLEIKVYAYFAKASYTVGDVLEAIKAFAQLGEDRERHVPRKITGNAAKKASK